MHTYELRGVQCALNLSERLLFQQPLPFRTKAHIVILRFDVIDLRNRKHVYVRAVPDRNSLHVRSWRTRGGNEFGWRKRIFRLEPAACAVYRFSQPLLREWLQKIIDSMDFEGAQGVFVVGSHEDDADFTPDKLEHFEAVETRHLDVQ